jgi:eukaryotic-like serine/threonine-protein kinase
MHRLRDPLPRGQGVAVFLQQTQIAPTRDHLTGRASDRGQPAVTRLAAAARLRAVLHTLSPTTDAWRQAMAAFEHWLALPEAERDAWLAQVAQAQVAYLPRLQAMIEADGRAEALDFLSKPAKLPLPSAGPDRTGLRMGPWALQDVIGRGGMGEVWRATRGDGLYSGQAAVKLQRAHSTHASADARFAREAELLARVSHPHVAQLLDAGITADGTRYLVLEYVQGERIDAWSDTRRLGVDERLQLFLQVCEAVAFAHAQRVVHRDLKPSNMLITGQGQLKLLDFGVAKLMGEGGASELTQLGAAGLTPEYAAPEQVEGGEVTPATDVYALGVLLYVLLAGARPYGDAASTPALLARAIVETEPGAMSAAAAANPAAAEARGSTARELRQRLRGDLDRIAAKALCKSAAERYVGAQALADDIGRHLRHEPVLAQWPTLRYRTAKFARRHRLPLTAAAVLVLALVTGGGQAAAVVIVLAVVAGIAATLWQMRKVREQARLAAAEADKARATKDFLLGVFNSNRDGAGDAEARQNTTARQLLEDGANRLLADKRLGAEARGELLQTLGELHDGLGLVASGATLREAAVQVLCKGAGDCSAGCVAALAAHSNAQWYAGEHDKARAIALDAKARAEHGGMQHSAVYAVVLRYLGHHAHYAGELQEALRDLQRAVDLFAEHEPLHPQHLEALLWLGNTHIQLENFDAALLCFERGLALAGQHDGLRDYGQGAMHQALADTFSTAGRIAESLPHFEQGIALSEKALGPRHPFVWMMRVVQARFRHQLGHADAWQVMDQALSVALEDTRDSVGKLQDRVHAAMATMALDEGDIDKALALNTVLVERYAGTVTLATVLMRQAQLELMSGPPGAARGTAERCLVLTDQQSGEDSIAGKQARVVLAEVLAQLGLESGPRPRAWALFEQALAPGLADRGGAPPPTLVLWRARARVGLSALSCASDAQHALQLAREAAAAISADTPILRERVVLAQAREAEGRALAQLGQPVPAEQALQAAVEGLAACQVAHSPRLRQAQRGLVSLVA